MMGLSFWSYRYCRSKDSFLLRVKEDVFFSWKQIHLRNEDVVCICQRPSVQLGVLIISVSTLAITSKLSARFQYEHNTRNKNWLNHKASAAGSSNMIKRWVWRKACISSSQWVQLLVLIHMPSLSMVSMMTQLLFAIGRQCLGELHVTFGTHGIHHCGPRHETSAGCDDTFRSQAELYMPTNFKAWWERFATSLILSAVLAP